MKKKWVQAVVACAIVVVAVLGLAPLFIHADSFRPTVESQLSSALGRKVVLGQLSTSLLSGGLVADNIAIADDPAFSNASFLQAQKLSIGVELLPLIFHRQLRITNFTVDSPAIQLIQAKNGSWNFSSLGGATSTPAAQGQSTIPDLTVSELKIENGSATVSAVPATARPIVYSSINLTVKQFSFAKSFPFQLSAKLPGDGSLELDGTAGPFAQKDASDTPFDATLRLKNFDPVAAGVVDPSKGISMAVDIDAQLKSDGTAITSNGKIEAQRLHLAVAGKPASEPVDLDYQITDNLGTRERQISDIAIHTGSVAAHVKGGFRSTPEAIVLDLHLTAPNLPVDQLEQLLPAVGITLPSGSSLKGGTLTANLAITGAATEADIAGPVEIDNTKLAGFDIGSKIGGINPFGGSGGGTEIQTLRTDLHSSTKSTEFSNIYGNLPQVGTASGGGSVSSAGALDFKLTAKFSPATGVGAVAGKAVNAAGNLLSQGLNTSASKGIPLTITGTTKDPSIHADYGAIFKPAVGGLLGTAAGNQKANAVGALKGLLGRRP